MSLPIDNTDELGEAMAALTPRDRLFVSFLFQPGTTTAAAARSAGFGAPDSTNATFARIGYRKRLQPSVVKAIAEECARQVRSLGPEALRGMREIIADKKHKDRGKMIRFIVEKIDPSTMLHQHQHDVTVKVEDHQLEAVRSLRLLRDQLKVPREVLIEHFGHSGLGHYERLEREGVGGSPKLIEHEAVAGSVRSERPRTTDADDESSG